MAETVLTGTAVYRSISPTLSPRNPEAVAAAKRLAIQDLKKQLESLQMNPAQVPTLSAATDLAPRELRDIQEREREYKSFLEATKQPTVLLGTIVSMHTTRDKIPKARPFTKWVRSMTVQL